MNKNTKNALCTLAVIAALVFLLGMVRSEGMKNKKEKEQEEQEKKGGFFKRKAGGCETEDGFEFCRYGDWVSAKNAKPKKYKSKSIDHMRGVQINKCRKACLDDDNCYGFTHNKKDKSCHLLGAESFQGGPGALKKDGTVDTYGNIAKFSRQPKTRPPTDAVPNAD